MSRNEVNRFGEMDVFVRVVDMGGFSAAARTLRMTPSAVSKLMARLETRLGTRLLSRSTRTLQLTPEGTTFYESSLRILADLEEAERGAGAAEQPAGRIRLNTSASYGTHILTPLLPEFLALYPAITLNVVQTDAIVDLYAERTDVAVRAGPLKNSSLMARKLGATRMVIVASPAYLERHGTPGNAGELEAHNRLNFCYRRAVEGWPLMQGNKLVTVPVAGNLLASDGEALRQMAVAGVGITRLAAFMVRDDLATGRLVPVLEDHNPGDREDFHAVFSGQGGYLPARVRVLLDFLAERGRVG
ncbi:MAG TPA: LysR family transcriptional regulator [Devosia sp.]|jgi:DNA-binding transcriptional LysR family regulator|uniref:LysR family transcriptional regulator n=1 Tax=Devosia sp. TaxID=1871048 RepID=UPI002DDD931E|nr:LysR family transcriptional regulator [Devosia sp.]HEV2514685.1 LysR family transcriptional regulator [Devosia sp.]